LQLERQGPAPFGLRLPQANLSRNLNQVARERREGITLPWRRSGVGGPQLVVLPGAQPGL